jgi:hypothetical protein
VLDAGDALNEAQGRVSTNWKRWIRDNCFLAVSTAQLYQHLARHRAEIEDKLAEFPDLSLRAARRLIAGPSTRSAPPPKSDLAAAMKRATDAELTAAFAGLGLPAFLRTMPPPWRSEMTARLRRRNDPGAPDIRLTEILRRGLSLIKIATTTPGITPAVASSNEHEALAAVRQLFVLISRAGLDLNDIAVIRSNIKREKKRAA